MDPIDIRKSRVIVTGGAGFLGRFVVERLRTLGCEEIFVPRQAKVDFTVKEAVADYYSEVKPDLVIHLAAHVGGIEANRRQPGTFFRDNMLMGLNVLEQGRVFKVKKIALTGTVCAYPKFAPVPFREDDIWNGYPEESNAPYGVAKKATLVMAQAYRQEFGTNAVMVFPVNMYGPGDNFDLTLSHVIPAMIRKFVEAKESGKTEVTLWGDGTPTREFLYVADGAEGIVTAAIHYNDPDPVNLGAHQEIAIRDLATVVAKLVGYTGTMIWDSTKPNGQMRRKLETSRAKERFGWVAKTDFETGMKLTYDWFLANRKMLIGS